MKHVEVVCAIIKKDNQYFCCKRGPQMSLAGFWEFPGGKIEENETQEEALIREIKEELDSKISVIKYIGVSNHVYSDLPKPFSITMYAYLCELVEGELVISEHSESKWALLEEMHNMDFAAADIPLIDLIK